jgi:hypothetical protein
MKQFIHLAAILVAAFALHIYARAEGNLPSSVVG